MDKLLIPLAKLPLGLSKALKDKGFNEACFYFVSNNLENISIPLGVESNQFRANEYEPLVALPLYQQVVDWFRIKHGLVLDVFQEFNSEGEGSYTGKWEVDISELGKYRQPHIVVIEDVYDDYYAAWNRAIEEALKLI